jgi:hypothetical protein
MVRKVVRVGFVRWMFELRCDCREIIGRTEEKRKNRDTYGRSKN